MIWGIVPASIINAGNIILPKNKPLKSKDDEEKTENIFKKSIASPAAATAEPEIKSISFTVLLFIRPHILT